MHLPCTHAASAWHLASASSSTMRAVDQRQTWADNKPLTKSARPQRWAQDWHATRAMGYELYQRAHGQQHSWCEAMLFADVHWPSESEGIRHPNAALFAVGLERARQHKVVS